MPPPPLSLSSARPLLLPRLLLLVLLLVLPLLLVLLLPRLVHGRHKQPRKPLVARHGVDQEGHGVLEARGHGGEGRRRRGGCGGRGGGRG